MTETFALGPLLDRNAGDLPLGFKQRLALACAVMHQPQVLFLDEPTSGVDPITRREFWSHINAMVEHGVTIMVTTHFMDEAEYCDRIGLVYRGHMIAEGSPDELKDTVPATEAGRTDLGRRLHATCRGLRPAAGRGMTQATDSWTDWLRRVAGLVRKEIAANPPRPEQLSDCRRAAAAAIVFIRLRRVARFAARAGCGGCRAVHAGSRQPAGFVSQLALLRRQNRTSREPKSRTTYWPAASKA